MMFPDPLCCIMLLLASLHLTWLCHSTWKKIICVSTTGAHTLNTARRCCKPVVFRAHSHLPSSMFDLWITEAFLWLFVNPSCRTEHTHTPYTRKTQGYCTPVSTKYNRLTLGEEDLPRYGRLELSLWTSLFEGMWCLNIV